MTDETYAIWSERVWTSYREELVLAGESEAAANENVARNREATMPDGALAEGQYVFDVRNDDEPVGVVWLAERDTEWFIYDIEIDASHQGRGFGRGAMRCIEEYVRERGGTAIGLSVFGFNERAQALYRSEGYDVVRISMSKKLTPREDR